MQQPGSEPLSDFMARLSAADRDDLRRLAACRTLARGELIFKAGSSGDSVYFLESGRVKIYHLSPAGREILLWFCFAGEIFGLAEVCHGGGREVYAEACEASQLLSVRQDDFKTFLEGRPAAALLVNDVLAGRLRNLGNLIKSLVVSDVDERVAQLLVRLAATYGRRMPNGDVALDIRLTHQEMANMIGSTRQSVTSALGALKRSGALDVQNRHILILDAAILGQTSAVVPPPAPAAR